MSEYEPITGELRGKMDTLGWYDEDGNIVFTTGGTPVSEIACLAINSKAFERLCDAIDAVHAGLERENAELRERVAVLDNERWNMRETDAWKLGYDEGFANADDWLAQHEDAMAEHGWVKGPLDADGEMWRSGDMSDSNWGVIEGIAYEDGRWFVSGHDTSAPWVPADSIRHHHVPTVEDVLREMLYKAHIYDEREMELLPDLISEYAKRLTLVGDAS